MHLKDRPCVLKEYQPDDPAVKALLTRDVSSAMKEPYKAAVEDCLIITMKGARHIESCHTGLCTWEQSCWALSRHQRP